MIDRYFDTVLVFEEHTLTIPSALLTRLVMRLPYGRKRHDERV